MVEPEFRTKDRHEHQWAVPHKRAVSDNGQIPKASDYVCHAPTIKTLKAIVEAHEWDVPVDGAPNADGCCS